jgi:pimeloyl-ACP methyl ester carboxylesterase
MLLLFILIVYADNWHGYNKINLVVNNHDGFVIIPTTSTTNKPWIWRTEFFDVEPQGDLALLDKGFHVAYIDVQNMYGAPIALDIMDLFYQQVVSQFNLSNKVILEGFSRGGLYAFNWAARNPNQTMAIYGDAPVLDFKSWPAGLGRSQRSLRDWQLLLQAYNLTEEQALLYQFNPIDQLTVLALANVPILCICGGADTVVSFNENTNLLEQRYKLLNGHIKVIVKLGCDHHPHSLNDPMPIVDFVVSVTFNITTDYTRSYIYNYCGLNILPFIIVVSIFMFVSVIIIILIYHYKKL